jgi:hypothetical protein
MAAMANKHVFWEMCTEASEHNFCGFQVFPSEAKAEAEETADHPFHN